MQALKANEATRVRFHFDWDQNFVDKKVGGEGAINQLVRHLKFARQMN